MKQDPGWIVALLLRHYFVGCWIDYVIRGENTIQGGLLHLLLCRYFVECWCGSSLYALESGSKDKNVTASAAVNDSCYPLRWSFSRRVFYSRRCF